MKRLAAIAIACLPLGGCMLPLAFSIASTAVDAILVATTDKNTTDHLISLAMMEDCALVRMLQGKEICVKKPAEIGGENPKDMYLKVRQPDGSVREERIVTIQPVHPIDEMPKDRTTGDAILAMRRQLGEKPAKPPLATAQDGLEGVPDLDAQ